MTKDCGDDYNDDMNILTALLTVQILWFLPLEAGPDTLKTARKKVEEVLKYLIGQKNQVFLLFQPEETTMATGERKLKLWNNHGSQPSVYLPFIVYF
ncbi:hypothetical protein AB6A40_007375 [Gnathostoma spinigerum]|uniref:Uncharacterized protein n=1 Tax=Gnathostoma spinigerum TaxID=75299 RepID=A0ABD6ET92_9BILA